MQRPTPFNPPPKRGIYLPHYYPLLLAGGFRGVAIYHSANVFNTLKLRGAWFKIGRAHV